MKFLLNIIILFSFISCGSRTEQKKSPQEFPTKPADTIELSELLGANEQRSVASEPTEPKPRTKTISLDSIKPTPCNIDAILYAYENIDSMSTEAIDIFLNVFSEQCSNNVEFSEFSQEMIFEVFGKYPTEVAELITKNDYNMRALTFELEAPLLDPLVEPIIADFKSSEFKNPKIDSIISSLERANQYLNHGK
jgi:hypothetical protein